MKIMQIWRKKDIKKFNICPLGKLVNQRYVGVVYKKREKPRFVYYKDLISLEEHIQSRDYFVIDLLHNNRYEEENKNHFWFAYYMSYLKYTNTSEYPFSHWNSPIFVLPMSIWKEEISRWPFGEEDEKMLGRIKLYHALIGATDKFYLINPNEGDQEYGEQSVQLWKIYQRIFSETIEKEKTSFSLDDLKNIGLSEKVVTTLKTKLEAVDVKQRAISAD